MSLKLIAIGCIHGRLPKKFLNLVESEKPDAVLISGDFSGGDFGRELIDYEKSLVEKFGPITEFWPLKVQIESEKKFQKWYKMSDFNTRKVFSQLKKLSTPIFYIHGNWDSVAHGKHPMEASQGFLVDKSEGGEMRFIHNKVVSIKSYSIAGFGGYRGTSGKEYLYKDLPGPLLNTNYVLSIRDELKKKMENLFKAVKNKRKMILLTHDPPYKTFDYLASAKKFYGEKVTRDLIRKYRPLACVCSHFHEHRGVKKIGKTFVIATGFGQKGQIGLIEINESKINVKLVG